MSEPYLIGLVGARGHTGAELLRLIGGHPELMLAFAVSREWAGRRVNEIAPEILDDCLFEALTPEEVGDRRADAVILALPDGAGADYVAAIQKRAPEKIIIDLSADYRFDDAWAYGLPELFRHRIAGKRRIANPGCYATAMQLAVAPLLDHLDGPPSLFGVSGYSGAGTTPSPRNDAERLKDNLMPYALAGHKHEREASRHLGRTVRFTPHVHPAFRGLLVTAHLPLAAPMKAEEVRAVFIKAYKDEPLVSIIDGPPELKDGTGRAGVVIGGFAVSADGDHAVVVAAEDNLLKGASVQAIQNLNLALGLDEFVGLPV
ncbi:N-acetyl-gamma-glutamyl-phosphate reductase [Amphiplicatus metriothermophilus]|uniref:N-acetyl-gamma-glutamyl-phosphate reductase n=1 Tax=Amphiplicatus metriothermophilus TaxID=1519374 RepID=A0A239PT67_9PROT|nr:N-acetyl-gamma-glutamyl-phosphate reductase [Amphiplicatus metriothermophilus]MBB5519370.1 N-acetyl-gamma-glutamyl-phosphate reductase [Amphiplicatus metriothermophilus]SNT73491.1 N-acetyl-gamma-glutamyl-phosphate reductase [Amphiplicatus metriothermophilus]